MRTLVLTSCGLLGLLACGGSTEPRSTLTVSGVVLDSLANRPLKGVRLYFGSDSTVTDSTGVFSFTAAAGDISVRFEDHISYESLERTLTVHQDTSVVLKVRRTLPYLTAYSLDASGILRATIIDPQGAETIERGFETWVVYEDPDVVQSTALPAIQWTWPSIP